MGAEYMGFAYIPYASQYVFPSIMNVLKGLFSKPTPVALGGSDKIVSCKIAEIRQESKDTKFFRFSLPNAKQLLGLPVGQHIRIVTEIDGKEIFRTYMPLKCDEPGHFDCIIKVYEQGRLTQWLNKKVVGDEVKVYGPIGLIKVENNVYTNNATKKVLATNPTKVGMIAGGSGITPMLQLVNSNDSTKYQLIYSNKTEDDILARKELESAKNLTTKHTLTREEVSGMATGRINLEMVKGFLDSDSEVIAICGPPEFVDAAKAICEEIFPGYSTCGGKSGAYYFKQ